MRQTIAERKKAAWENVGKERAKLEAQVAALRAERDELREALESIDRKTTEWDANKLGSVHVQRQRWQRCGEIARFVLARLLSADGQTESGEPECDCVE